MFKIFYIFILVHAIIMGTYSMALEDLIESLLTISSTKHNTIVAILNAIGGRDEFESELRHIVAEASSLRDGVPASVIEFKVSKAIIAKICFSDDICWAAKMGEISPYKYRAVAYGIRAMELVEEFCPTIPVAVLKGCNQHKLLYCFTEWIEGNSLNDELSEWIEGKNEVFGSPIYVPVGGTISIPDKIVTALAEFVYNLTTCPIPETLSKKASQSSD